MSNSGVVKQVWDVEVKGQKDLDKYTKSLKDNDKTTMSLKGSVAGLAKGLAPLTAGVVAVGTSAVVTALAVKKLADSTAAYADETGKAAQRMGVSLGYYQKMASAAGHAGTSVATMQTAMKTLVRTMNNADMGSKRQIEMFDALGVSIYGVSGELKDQEQIFSETLLALSKMDNQTKRNALSQELLGRSASDLNPMLNEGAEAIERYVIANESAVVVSEKMAKAGQEYNDTIQTMGEEIKQAKMEALEPFMESMNELLVFTKESGAWDGIIAGAKNLFEIVAVLGNEVAVLAKGWEWLLSGKKKSDEAIAARSKALGIQRDMSKEVVRYLEKIKEIDKLEASGAVTKAQAAKGRKNYQSYIQRQLEKETQELVKQEAIAGKLESARKLQEILLSKIGIKTVKQATPIVSTVKKPSGGVKKKTNISNGEPYSWDIDGEMWLRNQIKTAPKLAEEIQETVEKAIVPDPSLLERVQEFWNNYGSIAQAGYGVLTNASDSYYKRQEDNRKHEHDIQLQSIENSNNSEQMKARQKEQLEKDSSRKSLALRVKEWRADLLQATAKMGLAVVNALAYGVPPKNFVNAGIAGGMGLANIGVVASNKPRYYNGSRDAANNISEVKSNSAGDVVTANLRGGEIVLPPSLASEYKKGTGGNIVNIGSPSITVNGGDSNVISKLEEFTRNIGTIVSNEIERRGNTNSINPAYGGAI